MRLLFRRLFQRMRLFAVLRRYIALLYGLLIRHLFKKKCAIFAVLRRYAV